MSKRKWLWPLGVFFAAFFAGVIGMVVGARLVIGPQMQRDSMLYRYLSLSVAQRDVQKRLDTIEAAQRGDIDRVILLNCLFMRSGRVEMDVVLGVSEDPRAYDDLLRRVDAKIAELQAQGKCGRR